MTEVVFRTDKDWDLIDAELCRVKDFTPSARVEDGRVTMTLSRTAPYASIVFECDRLPHEATGLIGHRLDFLHLWNAFMDRGVGDDEEVLFFWTKRHLKRSARLVSKFMPRLWVMIFSEARV